MQNEKSYCSFCGYEEGHGLTCPLYVASKNPMEEDNNQKCVEGLESMGLFNRENFIPSKNPMEEIRLKYECGKCHRTSMIVKGENCFFCNVNQEDKSILKNIDYNVGTYEKIVEPIQEDKEWEIYRQKLTEQIHYSRQPFCVGCGMTVEGFDNLIKKTKQESYEEGKAKERVRSALIVEELMEDSEHWQPIAGRILERIIINKDDIINSLKKD